jgi:hypothetical protein
MRALLCPSHLIESGLDCRVEIEERRGMERTGGRSRESENSDGADEEEEK